MYWVKIIFNFGRIGPSVQSKITLCTCSKGNLKVNFGNGTLMPVSVPWLEWANTPPAKQQIAVHILRCGGLTYRNLLNFPLYGSYLESSIIPVYPI